MSIIYSSSFETEPSLASIFDTQVGTTLSFDSTHVYSGSRALKIHEVGAASASIKSLPANPGRVFCYRWGVYVTGFPLSATQNLVVIDGALVNCVISVNLAGNIRCQWPGGTTITGPVLPVNQYSVVDMLVDTSGTTYSCQWKVNGVAQTISTSAVQASGEDQVDYKIANSGANTYDYWHDMLVIANDGSVFPLPDPTVAPIVIPGNQIVIPTPAIPAMLHAMVST